MTPFLCTCIVTLFGESYPFLLDTLDPGTLFMGHSFSTKKSATFSVTDMNQTLIACQFSQVTRDLTECHVHKKAKTCREKYTRRYIFIIHNVYIMGKYIEYDILIERDIMREKVERTSGFLPFSSNLKA